MLRGPRSPLSILEACHALSRRLTDRDRAKLVAVQPEFGEFAFHLCHNWGTPEARAILARYDSLYSRYNPAFRRAYDAADKRRVR
jgi:hypothetical protein